MGAERLLAEGIGLLGCPASEHSAGAPWKAWRKADWLYHENEGVGGR